MHVHRVSCDPPKNTEKTTGPQCARLPSFAHHNVTTYRNTPSCENENTSTHRVSALALYSITRRLCDTCAPCFRIETRWRTVHVRVVRLMYVCVAFRAAIHEKPANKHENKMMTRSMCTKINNADYTPKHSLNTTRARHDIELPLDVIHASDTNKNVLTFTLLFCAVSRAFQRN